MKEETPPLLLASTSPFRRQVMERLRLPFATAAPDVDETMLADETPRQMAIRLARLKALKVAADNPATIVIAGDQVLEANARAYGKPGSRAGAIAQLAELAGVDGVFHSAMCVIGQRRSMECCVPTAAGWRELDAARIASYVDAEPSFGSAGAAQLENHGITLLRHLRSDDPTAILGLPLISLVAFLDELGVRLPG